MGENHCRKALPTLTPAALSEAGRHLSPRQASKVYLRSLYIDRLSLEHSQNARWLPDGIQNFDLQIAPLSPQLHCGRMSRCCVTASRAQSSTRGMWDEHSKLWFRSEAILKKHPQQCGSHRPPCLHWALCVQHGDWR